MRGRSVKNCLNDEELDTLVEHLCSHVKELYHYNEEIEKRRSSVCDMEREISDLEQKARHVTASINRLQSKIAQLN